MADAKKQKKVTFNTPKGTFKFPRLGEPDTKFKDAGEFSVKLVLAEADAASIIARHEDAYNQAIKDGKAKYAELPVATRKKKEFAPNDFGTPVYDDNEQETGETEFNFKMTASGVSKKTGKPWSRKPDVFDATGKKMDGAKVWGGSIGKVNYEVVPYWNPAQCQAGISLRLNAVQIIDLKSGQGRNASAYGFETEEGYADVAEETSKEAGKEGTESEEAQDF